MQARAATAPCTWKESDIIDPHIEVSAQKLLMSKMSQGGSGAKQASAMISAVKSGDLAGIYLNSRKAVADRGQQLSPPVGWWDLIPTGKNSTCLLQPSAEPPMIIFRSNLSQAQLDQALSSAWSQCGLPTPTTCGYKDDMGPPPAKAECTHEASCIFEGKGNYCNAQGKCEQRECTTTLDCTKPGEYCNAQKACVAAPKAPPPNTCYFDYHCGPPSAEKACVGAVADSPNDALWKAGTCVSIKEQKACIDKADKAHSKALDACHDEWGAATLECAAKGVEAVVAKKPDIGLVPCATIPAKWDACLNDAHATWHAARKACVEATKTKVRKRRQRP